MLMPQRHCNLIVIGARFNHVEIYFELSTRCYLLIISDLHINKIHCECKLGGFWLMLILFKQTRPNDRQSFRAFLEPRLTHKKHKISPEKWLGPLPSQL